MKNKLSDLNDHLFAQIERLNDEDACSDPEKAKVEVLKAQAMSKVASQIIANAKLSFEAFKYSEELAIPQKDMPVMLEVKK